MSFRIFTCIVVWIVYCSCNDSRDKANIEAQSQIMAYYVPSKRKPVADLPLDKLTHIIFSFTKIIDGQMKFDYDSLSQELGNLVKQARKYPNLKVMIACGGWDGSGGFSDMAMTKESRSLFIKSTIDLLKKYKLDGLDFDWEYPGLPGIGNTYRDEDKENFTVLIKEMRMAIDTIKPGMILTFASAGWKRYFDFIELSELIHHVDYMNIMTYDLAGSNVMTSHHTALYGSGDIEKSSLSVDEIVQFCIEKGVDPSKIVIGAAFYGRSWNGVDPNMNGLYQPYSGSKSSYSYTKLQTMLESDNNYKRYWDEDAKAPYIYNAQDSTFLTYDDPESLAEKAKYVQEQELGGIMFWQLSHDTKDDILVNSIYNQLRE